MESIQPLPIGRSLEQKKNKAIPAREKTIVREIKEKENE